MGDISPDLLEWITADHKVSQKWRNIARRVGLQQYILDIDCGRWGERGRRRAAVDSQKLGILMKVWREKRPDIYNVRVLKNVLAAEGLNDMWMWINMMTMKESPTRSEANSAVYSRISTPLPISERKSPSSTSPWSTYLYSPHPSSPYSNFFKNPTESLNSCDYSPFESLSIDSMSRGSSPNSSRPTSRQSDHMYSYHHRDDAYASDYKHPFHASSCPTSPLTNRRIQKSSTINSFGCMKPNNQHPETPYRSSSITRKSDTTKKGVFDLLYRPDLIKLSSPMNAQRSRPNSRQRTMSCTSIGSSNANDCGYKSPVSEDFHTIKIDNNNQSNNHRYKDEKSDAVFTSHKEIKFDNRKAKENDLVDTCDILKLCDNLLEDIKNSTSEFKANQLKLKEQDDKNLETTNVEQVSKYNNFSDTKADKYSFPFKIQKVKKVELETELSRCSLRMPSPRRGDNNTYEEYFDNLLSMIEKAAMDLTE